jgi:hypothetical protein
MKALTFNQDKEGDQRLEKIILLLKSAEKSLDKHYLTLSSYLEKVMSTKSQKVNE